MSDEFYFFANLACFVVEKRYRRIPSTGASAPRRDASLTGVSNETPEKKRGRVVVEDKRGRLSYFKS